MDEVLVIFRFVIYLKELQLKLLINGSCANENVKTVVKMDPLAWKGLIVDCY